MQKLKWLLSAKLLHVQVFTSLTHSFSPSVRHGFNNTLANSSSLRRKLYGVQNIFLTFCLQFIYVISYSYMKFFLSRYFTDFLTFFCLFLFLFVYLFVWLSIYLMAVGLFFCFICFAPMESLPLFLQVSISVSFAC